jgi:gentisate 1,2-dioxygenase
MGMPTKAQRLRSGSTSLTCPSYGTLKLHSLSLIPRSSSGRYNGTGTQSVEIAKDALPTIGLHAIRLQTEGVTDKLHETANNIYAVVSGAVCAGIDGHEDEVVLGRGDVLAVPLWHGHVLHGVEDATLLRVTDEPIMAKFGLLRHA